jgi:hypothetical protein
MGSSPIALTTKVAAVGESAQFVETLQMFLAAAKRLNTPIKIKRTIDIRRGPPSKIDEILFAAAHPALSAYLK